MLPKIRTYQFFGVFLGLSISLNLIKLVGTFDAPVFALSIDEVVKPIVKIPTHIEVWCNKLLN